MSAITEITVDGTRYLITNGMFGYCSGSVVSGYVDIYLTRHYKDSPNIENICVLPETPELYDCIFPIYFPNGLNINTDQVFVDPNGFYRFKYYDTYGSSRVIPTSGGMQSDIYYLPANSVVLAKCYAQKDWTGSLYLKRVYDSNLGSLQLPSALVTFSELTPIELTSYPPLLLSTHRVVKAYTSNVDAWAAASSSNYTTTCDLSTNYTFDTSKCDYYAVSIVNRRSASRYFVYDDSYLLENTTANTCKVSSHITNDSASAHKSSSDQENQMTLNVLWVRDLKNGLL